MKKINFGSLNVQIVIAMIMGILLGVCIHHFVSEETSIEIGIKVKVLATVFIRLVQMIIAPLVFTTLVVGIAKLGDAKTVGRIGLKAVGWFLTASLLSLTIGLIIVHLLQPGVGLHLTRETGISEIAGSAQHLSFEGIITHIFPKSVFEALANNEVLQVVVFSIFFGLAAASLGNTAKPVIKILDKTAHIVLTMVNYVMKFAPLGVFGAITAVFAEKDFMLLMKTYGSFFGSFLVGIFTLWIVLTLIGYLFLGKRMTTLLHRISDPLVIAFSTTSSEAVFPKLKEELENFGIRKRLVSFILPLGYSFNLDGSMMYMTFASLFIAQVYGVEMTLSSQIIMLLVLMLTSKGIAGVPRASLVIIAATCGMFNIPIEGIALILPIDHFCDMFRSATNVLGNAIATTVIGKWEHEDGGKTEEPIEV